MGFQGALSFPAAPTIGQTHDHTGKTYQWNGVGWRRIATAAQAAYPPGLRRIASGQQNNVASIDFVLTGLTTLYRGFLLKVFSAVGATDGSAFGILLSTDGGATFDTAASSYGLGYLVQSDTPANLLTAGLFTSMQIGSSIPGNGTTEGFVGEIEIMGPQNAAQWTKAIGHGYIITNEATPAGRAAFGGGARKAAQDTDAFRIQFAAGNIVSIDWGLYGYT